MKCYFQIKLGCILIPADKSTQAYIEKKKEDSFVSCDLTTPQNYKFHQKLIKLFEAGFDAWTPEIPISKFGVPEKNFDQFRKDITILAGYYTSKVRLNGDVIFEAKSISFKNMDADEREKLFSDVINALLKHVLKNYTKEDLENQINTILGFT